jgi:hypothetical protein
METILGGAIAGIAGVLLIVGFVNWREGRKPEARIPVGSRQRGEPLSWTYTTGSSDFFHALEELGLHATSDSGSVAHLEGGSQVKTRLLGGYFVKPSDLPITVLVSPSSAPGGHQSIEVRDRIGPIGLRDRALAGRYAMRAEEIRQAVDGVETR